MTYTLIALESTDQVFRRQRGRAGAFGLLVK